MLRLLILAGFIGVIAFPNFSNAGPFQDQLLVCAQSKLTSGDEANYARHLVFSFGQHPALEGVFPHSKAEAREASNRFVRMITRIFTNDCLVEAQLVFRNEGESALISTSLMFGQIISRRIVLNNPEVATMLEGEGWENLDDEWSRIFEPTE